MRVQGLRALLLKQGEGGRGEGEGALFRAESVVKAKSHRNRVVNDALIWCRELPEGCQIRPRIHHPSDDWKALPVHSAVNGYLFRIREGLGTERRGMGSVFHQLFPRYNGSLSFIAPTDIASSRKVNRNSCRII